MDFLSTEIWTLGLAVGLVLVLWLWARKKGNAAHEGMGVRLKGNIRVWLNAVGKEEYLEGEERFERLFKDLVDRLSSVEGGLIHQHQLEDLAVDLRQRLHRLEQSTSQAFSEPQMDQPGIPRSVLRHGVRITLTDNIWKELGVVQPTDLPDNLIDKILQGPFCRNCLRSLVASVLVDGERSVRHQCRHCSLSWRVDPESSTVPLRQFKREIYELLDAEYRRKGAVAVRDEGPEA